MAGPTHVGPAVLLLKSASNGPILLWIKHVAVYTAPVVAMPVLRGSEVQGAGWLAGPTR